MSRGAQSLDGQHLLCIHYRAHSVVTGTEKPNSTIYALGKSGSQACANPIYFDYLVKNLLAECGCIYRAQPHLFVGISGLCF